jgi:hypothetical protein
MRALAVAVVALFVGAGGGAAWASGLISGKQIVDHSIPERKLTAGAVKALRGQRGPAGPRGRRGDAGPQGHRGDTGARGAPSLGAISINLGGIVAEASTIHTFESVAGVDATYWCQGNDVVLGLYPHLYGDTVFVSGDEAGDGTLTSLQLSSDNGITASGLNTANLDVVAWAGKVGTLTRFDLGAYIDRGARLCNVWGLVTPGS